MLYPPITVQHAIKLQHHLFPDVLLITVYNTHLECQPGHPDERIWGSLDRWLDRSPANTIG